MRAARSRLLSGPALAATVTVLAGLLAGLLGGCGGGEEPQAAPPTIGGSASASASEPDSASPDPSESPAALPTGRAEAAKLHVTVLGRNGARNDAEQAVVDAWMGYWSAVTETYFTREPARELDRYARKQALTDVLDYVARLKARDQVVVGWARDNVLSVKIVGSTAVVRDCTRNNSFAVDSAGKPTETPSPYYATGGVLSRQQGSWRVITVKSQDRDRSCLGGDF